MKNQENVGERASSSLEQARELVFGGLSRKVAERKAAKRDKHLAHARSVGNTIRRHKRPDHQPITELELKRPVGDYDQVGFRVTDSGFEFSLWENFELANEDGRRVTFVFDSEQGLLVARNQYFNSHGQPRGDDVALSLEGATSSIAALHTILAKRDVIQGLASFRPLRQAA